MKEGSCKLLSGGHVVIYSTDAEADRAFFRGVLGFDHVDAGDGWLVFALPPSEIAFHPSDSSGTHEFYFMCDDIEATRAALKNAGAHVSQVSDEGWGLLAHFTLPGGGRIGVYQPRHAKAV